MYRIALFNKIPKEAMNLFSEDKYEIIRQETGDADGIVMRSMDIHNMKFSKSLKAIARSGAGINNIPVEKCSEEGIVVYSCS